MRFEGSSKPSRWMTAPGDQALCRSAAAIFSQPAARKSPRAVFRLVLIALDLAILVVAAESRG